MDELVARVDVDVGRSTVSHRLKILAEVRFVLVEKRGRFRVIGRRVRVGRHHGRWRDTGMLECRSRVVG